MSTKRFDQLSFHPRTAVLPLSKDASDVLIPIRDPSLPNDNTVKVKLLDAVPFPRFNIRDFGADGSGSTDSTAAIQACIDAAAGEGCTVFMPRGTYRITNLVIYQGIHLLGDGVGSNGTVLLQPDGVNNDAIISDPGLNGLNYIHWTHLENFRLAKENGGLFDVGIHITDTYGSGIYFPNFCGEGTKFSNLEISGFPNHGLRVNGAITCWFQDIACFGNGISQEAVDNGYHPGPAQLGYGIYLYNSSGFTGHYLLGISGDNNANALIGARHANVTIMGVKSECHSWQNYAVELEGSSDSNWCILNGITATLNSAITPRPSAVVHITNSGGGYMVHLTGISRHEGAVSPDHIIIDSVLGKNLDYVSSSLHHMMMTCWSSWFGGEMFHIDDDNGPYMRIGQDPPAWTSTPNFALGHTNGVGLGAGANLSALQKGAATNCPASMTVNHWVRAQLDGVDGWIPFFV